jgi:serine/threonine protein kinase/tetratricopeptide (TPR) repeat protein
VSTTEEDLTLEEPLDPRVEEAFGEFLEQRNRGAAEDPLEFLARYPTIQEELRACLRGIGVEIPDAARRPDGLEHIGPYQLVRVIGRGGMGVVYEARGPESDLRLALKVLNANLRGQGRTAKRFEREAETLRTLEHENIVPVLDAGVDGELLYYVMPLVEGRSLDRVLEDMRQRDGRAAPPELSAEETWYGDDRESTTRGSSERAPEPKRDESPRAPRSGRMDPRRRADIIECRNTARLFVEVCDALQHAHSRNIIHRDIKPANLILDHENRLRITDFGLAKRQDAPSVTQSGDLIGTPMYMSPEQAMAKRIPVDHRTDIYSLGATIYECLAFTPPFEGSTTAEVLRQVISKEPVRLSRHNANVPLPLEAIVHKALDKDPDRRYQNAALMGQDLQRYLAGRPVEASFPSWPKRMLRRAQRQPLQTAAIILMIAFVLAGSGWWLFRQIRRNDPRQVFARQMESIDTALERGAFGSAEEALLGGWPDVADRPVDVRARLGTLLWRTRRDAEAYRELRRAGDSLTAHPFALRLRLALHAMHGAYTAAREDLERCRASISFDPDAARLEWIGALLSGAWDHTEELVQRLERQSPEHAVRPRLWLDVERGRLAEVGAVLEPMEERYPGSSGLAWPRWLERRGEVERASEALRRLLVERRLYREEQEIAQLWLGDALLRATPPRADEASEALRQAVDAGIGYPARVAFASARRAARKPSSEEADFLLQRLESEYPDLALARRVRAQVQLDAGLIVNARRSFDRALDADPADPRTRWVGIWIELCEPSGRGDLRTASALLAPIAALPTETAGVLFWGAAIDAQLWSATPPMATTVVEDAYARLGALDPAGIDGRVQAYRIALSSWLHLLDPERPAIAWSGRGERVEWTLEGERLSALPFAERLALLRCSTLLAERLGALEEAEFLGEQTAQLSNAWLDRFAAARIAAWRGLPQASFALTALAAEAGSATEPNVRARVIELWDEAQRLRAPRAGERDALAQRRNDLLQHPLSEHELALLSLAECEWLARFGENVEARTRAAQIGSPSWFHRPLALALRRFGETR